MRAIGNGQSVQAHNSEHEPCERSTASLQLLPSTNAAASASAASPEDPVALRSSALIAAPKTARWPAR